MAINAEFLHLTCLVISYMNLILFGYKSSGKTFFGNRLARELGKLFIDTDQLVEELYKKEFGEERDCRQISLKIGEEGFRKLESKVIDALKGGTHAIIAVGGGTVLNPENCLKLVSLGRLIYLEGDKETIKRRIFSNGIPSFLDPNDPENSFERMYEERKPIYEKVSTVKVKIQGKTVQQILNELKDLYQA